MIEKGIGSPAEIAKALDKSIPKVMTVRREIADAMSDPLSIFNANIEDETVH